MYEHTRNDRIRNEAILNMVGVTFVEDKMRKARLRWLECVRRDTWMSKRGDVRDWL